MIYNQDSLSDGIISAYSLESGTINEEWQNELETRISDPIVYGDTILVSSLEGPKALNRENGNEVFSENTQPSQFGMPYNEKNPCHKPN